MRPVSYTHLDVYKRQPLADVNQGGDLLDRVVMIRRQIALELGCVVPMIRLRDNIPVSYTHLTECKTGYCKDAADG